MKWTQDNVKEKLSGRHREMQMATNKLDGNCEGLESVKRRDGSCKSAELVLIHQKRYCVPFKKRISRKST